jgi:hypothetical protein
VGPFGAHVFALPTLISASRNMFGQGV